MDNKIISPDHPKYGFYMDTQTYMKNLFVCYRYLTSVIEIEHMKKDPHFKKLMKNFYEMNIETIKQLREGCESIYKVYMKIKQDFDQSELANLEAQNPS